ncbi:hypothetical protein FJZ53_02265 [Candidatus Woesearchaeota archaeon]|nr:hypothetical protein [Candidatus Woesearchaeota archaeon]
MRRILILILLLLPMVKAEVLITEIMANPLADEDLNEWVELYNNSTEFIDMKGWSFGDDKDNDTLKGGLYNGEGTIIPSQGYAILTDSNTRVYNNFNVSSETIKLYCDDDTLGNGLRNSGETVWLYSPSRDAVQEVTYQETGEGLSYSLIGDNWTESEPTPGYGDIAQEEVIKTGCDWKVEILTNLTFINDPEFEILVSKVYGEKNNLTLNRRIKDVFGGTVKEYGPLEVEDALNYRTYKYSPNLKSNNAYVIEANINSDCDTIPENDKAQQVIFVQGEKAKEESTLEITQVYDLGQDKTASWGQTIKARLKVYKGNTNKKAIDIWTENGKEKASKQASISLEDKYTTTEITIPLQLKPNCDKKLKDGEYRIIAEGLDLEADKKITIKGENKETCQVIKEIVKQNVTVKSECPAVKQESLKNATKKETPAANLTTPHTESPAKITGEVVYQSKDAKTKKIGQYVYAGIIAMIITGFLIKRKLKQKSEAI